MLVFLIQKNNIYNESQYQNENGLIDIEFEYNIAYYTVLEFRFSVGQLQFTWILGLSNYA
ncbi:hypothetical protein TTHERM_000600119 (macronuclear) [Tetrahymena thermophila SB210]|uniref:Uncharacterized protein n=1 Tax=Tetrahymena thermophila (strain SB210) TaxID=312017 RepID=W7XGI1_TETTS|nr:hypothetical protein TTHERM_000600119 [Tetrahymena thermophila SB210]EWS73251.1 hypothetical protein TTHERM_000600119 [Tetrahymena thermophila SB210]|eukprot:XP_012654215.1 hypothetical protein TTHERM_000600119 [Tetrahymena thermophila SB210]